MVLVSFTDGYIVSPTVHRAFDSKAFGFLPDHDSLSLISTISLTNQGGMQATNLSVCVKSLLSKTICKINFAGRLSSRRLRVAARVMW